MKNKQMLVLLLLLGFGGGVYAGAMNTFDDIDDNGDGYITKSEAKDLTTMKSNWMQADTDKDGKIDVSEFSAFEGKNMFQPPDVEDPEPGAAPTK